MSGTEERINTPISTAELERRWKLVRAAMKARNIDVLVMQNNNDFMGGYVKYFTDFPATNGYPLTVIFPRDDEMTMIGQGPFGMDAGVQPGDPLRRGVKRVMGVPGYASASYCKEYDAELAEKALSSHPRATIGLVGTSSMPYAFVDYLKRGKLSNSSFVDASDLVDEIRSIKSAEEIATMRATCGMQDMQMEAAFKAVAPGRRDMEVMSAARHAGTCVGSEQGWYMCASGPVGTAAVMSPPHLQNRIIRAGDQYTILIENNGAGGFYTELGRTCVLGKASQEMKDEFAFVLEARAYTLRLLKPGASCKEIWESHNAFMRKNGRPEEQRLYCHSQGYDMVERPLVRFDETMTIQANMVLAVHPTYVTSTTYSWACDNYLVTESGVERLHKFPERITELG
ncbi:M24 family metallopeptidase [Roseiarcaceae bacterium H3SJ34-1]|uniref:M24 family metallopeptidase n=1 Tax=Terripilifer ovatus TaxID=3032367 RepID=UPI003AB9A529|nr:M24 family metallopeptidase [Roseiarcaceae bacterium H3SJ34-1]